MSAQSSACFGLPGAPSSHSLLCVSQRCVALRRDAMNAQSCGVLRIHPESMSTIKDVSARTIPILERSLQDTVDSKAQDL